jgi:site-specific recombinase
LPWQAGKSYQTVLNYLKEFNPSLFGWSFFCEGPKIKAIHKFLQSFNWYQKSELKRSDLITLLEGLGPAESLEKRMQSLKEIMEWLRQPAKINENSPLPSHLQSRNIRLKFLLQFIERHGEAQGRHFIHTLQDLFSRGIAVRLYCLTGMSDNNGFFNELSDRMIQKFIPHVYADKDLAELFKVIFTEEEDAEWFEVCHKDIIPPFMELIAKHEISTQGLQEDQSEALILLGSQISALGMERSIRRRLTNQRLSESPFLQLGMSINRGLPDNLLLQEISHCRLKLQEVRQNIESTGVSVTLIYYLEKMNALLDRVEMLLYLRQENDPETQSRIIANFIGRLIREDLQSLGIKDYLKENLHMLTRKIVERAGEKGAHYIANTPQERAQLWRAASWAGVLTAFTAIFKFWIGLAHFPLFFEGFFFFCNYALGFLIMQRFHLALSSKQPAYTASALSRKFEEFKRNKELAEIGVEIKKISYSQLIASLGNLFLVIPVVVLVDWLWYFSFGHHIVTQAQAMDIVAKHNPLTSFTIFYAAFTGILLWLSSVVAGWVENWIVFRNIPQIIRESETINQIFGKLRARHAAEHFSQNMGAIAGNLAIALFLASPIIIGKMFGLPLDIRHVTLAAGTMTLAMNSLEWSFHYWPQLLTVFFSIILIGILNFSVSFYCSVRMAAMARNVENKYLRIIFKYAFTSTPRLKQ